MPAVALTILLLVGVPDGRAIVEGSVSPTSHVCRSGGLSTYSGVDRHVDHSRPWYYSAQWRAINYGPTYHYRTQFDYPWRATSRPPQTMYRIER